MKVFIGEKYSCALNYQHNYIRNWLKEKVEITENVEDADIIVFASTCACTEGIINSVMNYIATCLQKKKPEAKVYLTGCLTRKFKDYEFLKKVEKWLEKHIDCIVPQNEPNLLLQKISDDFINFSKDNFGLLKFNENVARFYIGNGCLNNCAFCKVCYQPYPLKSVDITEIKEAIDEANELKYPYIELLATNLSQYGIDLYDEARLPEIIEYIEKQKNIKYLELVGFSYKDAIKFHFAEPLSKSSKLSYISGSLETGSPRLLEMIRKGFTPEEIIDFVKKIKAFYPRDLDINIISGLPTENFDDIRETLKVLNEIDPYFVNICEYGASSFLEHLNSFPQLTTEDKRSHTRIYKDALTRKRIKNQVCFM